MRKITKEEFILRASDIHKNKYLYNKVDYINTSTKVIITCPIHGDFEQTPSKHLQGLKCYRERLKFIPLSNTLEFIEKAKNIHKNLYDYSKVDYINAKTPVIIICHKHEEFSQTPDNHLHGRDYPYCKSKQLADLYNKLKSLFPDEEILYEVGNRVIPLLEGQRFDIYFPKYNIAIEYNGLQHYMPIKRLGGEISYIKTIEWDKEKCRKCVENNCILFELKYDYSELDFYDLCKAINDRTGLIHYRKEER